MSERRASSAPEVTIQCPAERELWPAATPIAGHLGRGGVRRLEWDDMEDTETTPCQEGCRIVCVIIRIGVRSSPMLMWFCRMSARRQRERQTARAMVLRSPRDDARASAHTHAVRSQNTSSTFGSVGGLFHLARHTQRMKLPDRKGSYIKTPTKARLPLGDERQHAVARAEKPKTVALPPILRQRTPRSNSRLDGFSGIFSTTEDLLVCHHHEPTVTVNNILVSWGPTACQPPHTDNKKTARLAAFNLTAETYLDVRSNSAGLELQDSLMLILQPPASRGRGFSWGRGQDCVPLSWLLLPSRGCSLSDTWDTTGPGFTHSLWG